MTNQPSGGGDQNIIITYILKADETIQKAQEVRNNINLIKEKMKEVAAESKTSFADVAKAMKSEAQQEYIAKLEAMKAKLKELQTVYKDMKVATDADKKAKLDDIEAQKQAIQGLKAEYRSLGTQITSAATELNAKPAGGGGGGILGGLGGIGGLLAGAGALVGITSLIQVVRTVVTYLGEAATKAKDFTQSIYAMSVGVRALQRAGVDITMQEMASQIDSLKRKFGVFSRVDLVEGAAAFLNLNRDMGFTRDQLFELQNAIATLAVVNGRSMDEVQRTVALALSSGYTEGLQRLGVSINRVTIAAEAARLGWEGGYTSLTEQQRALATYNLVIEKTNIYQSDLLFYQTTLPGKIDTTTKALQDQNVALGENFQGFVLWWSRVKLSLAELATALTTIINSDAAAAFQEGFLKQQEERLGRILTLEEKIMFTQISYDLYMKGAWGGGLSVQQIFERYGVSNPNYNPEMPDVPVTPTKTFEEAYDKASEVIDGKLEEILQIQEEFQDRSTELWEDYQKDLEKLSAEHAKKQKELFDDWSEQYLEAQADHEQNVVDEIDKNEENVAEIEQKWLDNRAKAQEDYNNSIAQVWQQYYSNLRSAQEKYHNKEEDAEIAFQEKMRKLREGFLFDLQDALRARDARQVMNLIRRYTLDKTQAEREYQQEKDKMWRDYQQQLADLARQRDERLAQLFDELTKRLEAIDKEHTEELRKEEERHAKAEAAEKKSWDKRRADLAAQYKKRADEATADYNERVAERDARYLEDVTALSNWMTDRYTALAEGLAKEVGITDTEMEAVRKALNDTLGPGGEAQAIFDYYIAYANLAASSAANALGQISAMETWLMTLGLTPGSFDVPVPEGPGKAKGGTMIANRATQVTFGEAGLELAQFTPLTRPLTPSLETNIQGTPELGKGSGPGQSGRMAIEIVLDKYLEGRIIDETLDNVADVIIRRLR